MKHRSTIMYRVRISLPVHSLSMIGMHSLIIELTEIKLSSVVFNFIAIRSENNPPSLPTYQQLRSHATKKELTSSTDQHKNEGRIAQGHETPLRVIGDIEDVSKVALLGGNSHNSIALGELEAPNKTSSRIMITIKCDKRENNLKCPEII
ncbi:hypothetical protein TNCV_4921291 [Trichonephila clavipes]|nr:hypothetical protein TNCV_4921291 [Trichonephila clavipes]